MACACESFVDPVNDAVCVLHVCNAPGVEHPGCEYRGTIHPHIDTVYCAGCGFTGRVSGLWATEQIMASRFGRP